MKIAEAFEVSSSKRVLKKDWKTFGVPFYRGREITALSREGQVENELFISEELYSELEQKYGVPKAGDILITAIGTIGNTYVVKNSDRFYFKDGSVLRLAKKTDVVDEYVHLWFQSTSFKNQLDKGNGATVDTLTIEKLSSMEIYLPSIREQQEVVSKLNDFLVLEKLMLQNGLALQKEFTEFFGAVLDATYDDLGLRYASRPTSEMLDVRDGTHDSPKFQKEGYPFITSKNLKKGELDFGNVKYISQEDFDEFNKRSRVGRGDLLFGMIGTIGNPVVVGDSPEFAIKNVALVKANPKHDLNFLRFYYLSPKIKNAIVEGTKGTTQKFVGLGNLRAFRFVDVPLEIQKIAVEKFKEAERVLNQLEFLQSRSLKLIAELRDSIFTSSFNESRT